MMYVVDSILVDPADTDRYLELLDKQLVPSAKKRGMDLVACWHTRPDLGEDVTVMTVWSVKGDYAEWNELRKRAVLDPAWHQWLEEALPLRKGGTRRFYHPAAFSPMR